MRIEPATMRDVAEIAAIYAHHVRSGTASFESIPPDEAEMARRLTRVTEAGSPWLIARGDDAAVLGYAYASQFRDRAAYRYTCENSVYVRDDQRGRGVGTALLGALLDAATAQGYRQMIAVIGGAEPGSAALHARCGFIEAGRMTAIGRKHGRWLDTLYMQAALGEGAASPPPKEPA